MANNRYTYPSNAKFDPAKGRVFTSMYYPKIEVSPFDLYIITKETDRLDLLAMRYYRDVNLWWIIAHANQIKGTFFMEPGTQLRIPMNIAQIFADLQTINNS